MTASGMDIGVFAGPEWGVEEKDAKGIVEEIVSLLRAS